MAVYLPYFYRTMSDLRKFKAINGSLRTVGLPYVSEGWNNGILGFHKACDDILLNKSLIMKKYHHNPNTPEFQYCIIPFFKNPRFHYLADVYFWMKRLN